MRSVRISLYEQHSALSFVLYVAVAFDPHTCAPEVSRPVVPNSYQDRKRMPNYGQLPR